MRIICQNSGTLPHNTEPRVLQYKPAATVHVARNVVGLTPQKYRFSIPCIKLDYIAKYNHVSPSQPAAFRSIRNKMGVHSASCRHTATIVVANECEICGSLSYNHAATKAPPNLGTSRESEPCTGALRREMRSLTMYANELPSA